MRILLLVIVTLVAATLAGYVYARFRSRFLSTSAFGLLAVRMLPPIIVTVPLFAWFFRERPGGSRET